MQRIFLAVFVLFSILVAGCSRHEVTREQWMRYDAHERELIVRSFLGGEQAEDSKGGRGQRYTREPSFYLAEIDRRYAAGDERNVNEIWGELSDRELASPPQ